MEPPEHATSNDTRLSQLRSNLQTCFTLMVNQSRTITAVPEFTGHNQNYKEFRTTLISQLSTISTAYRLQLSTPAEYITFDKLRHLLPIWIHPEYTPNLDEDHPDEVLEFYETATRLCNEMIHKINEDITSRLYWYIISVLKGDARQLCIQKTQEQSEQTPQRLLTLLNERYDKADLTKAMSLQRELFSIRVNQGSNIRRVIDDFTNRVAKLRFELSRLGQSFPDETITSLVLSSLQNSRILPTTIEMILQSQETDTEKVFTILRDSALRKQLEHGGF